MPSTVEKLGPTRAKLTIEIPFADLKPHLDKAYKDIANQVNIPGFRKGKVPAAIIDQRFGRGMVLQEAINEALPDAYSQALAESGLYPLGQPEIDVTKLEDGELVEFTAELDVRPDFEVPSFDELTAEVPVMATDDSEVEGRIDMMRQRFATRSDKDEAAEDGDVVTIDLVATKDGEEVEDGSAEGLSYKVGSGGMLDGLDDALKGMKAGDEKEFTSVLVGGPAKGEEATIKVTVSKVQSEVLPELNDEFAQMVSEFDTVDEMKADLADAVVRMARIDQVNAARDAVLADLVEKTPFELPEAMLTSEIEGRRQSITDQLARVGMTLEEYLAETEEEEAEDADAFWAQVEKNAETSLKAQIILDKIAEDREIGVEQQELTEMLFRRAQQSGTSPEQEMQHMMEHNHAPEWMAEIRRSKALALLVNDASVTDADGAVVNIAAVRPDGTIDESVEAKPAKAPAKKAPAKKAPAKKAAAKDEAPAEDAAADEAKADEAKAEEAPAKKAPAKKAPAKKAPAKKAAAKDEAPAEDAAADEAKAEEAEAPKKPARKPAAKKPAAKDEAPADAAE